MASGGPGELSEVAASEVTGAAPMRQDAPLGGQVRARVDLNAQLIRRLEAEIAGLSLDVLLDDGVAADRRKRLVGELHEARASHRFLVEAYETALARDGAAEAEVAIAAIKAEFSVYRQVADARVVAFQDMTAISAAADEAVKRYRQALFLLETMPPRKCRLPLGFKPSPGLETIEEIEQENEYLLQHFENQIAEIAAVLRGERSEAVA